MPGNTPSVSQRAGTQSQGSDSQAPTAARANADKLQRRREVVPWRRGVRHAESEGKGSSGRRSPKEGKDGQGDGCPLRELSAP